VNAAVADDQPGPVHLGVRVAGQGCHAHAALLGAARDRVVVGAVREAEQDMEPRGDPFDRQAGERARERCHQGVAAAPVGVAGAADVAVVLAAADEFCEGTLLERRRADIEQVLDPLCLVDKPLWKDRPGEPERRCECLRGRAEIGDAGVVESLDRPDRFAVVAELGVVVVLDDERITLARPVEQLAASGAAHDDPGRELMGRGDENGVRVESVEAKPFAVDRLGDGLQLIEPEAFRLAVERRIFDRDTPRAGEPQQSREQVDPLGGAGDDNDLLRCCDHAARSSQLVGERLAEQPLAARLGVVEGGERRRTQHVGERGQPAPAREEREVRRGRGEVVPRRPRRRRLDARLRWW
jgi:hypothetical protein